MKQKYEADKKRGTRNEVYLKETSRFMIYCDNNQIKFEKYFPHLNVNQRCAKLWEQYCLEWPDEKLSEAV